MKKKFVHTLSVFFVLAEDAPTKDPLIGATGVVAAVGEVVGVVLLLVLLLL
jgi:hypothetical protein